MNLPESYENVMVTYMKIFYTGPYGDTKEKREVTKRGFYTDTDGYYNALGQWIETPNGKFAIPPNWAMFNGILLPDGWGGDRVLPEQVIKWEYIKDEN
jgi:hypothetical protein